jgi:hypothetical protein
MYYFVECLLTSGVFYKYYLLAALLGSLLFFLFKKKNFFKLAFALFFFLARKSLVDNPSAGIGRQGKLKIY